MAMKKQIEVPRRTSRTKRPRFRMKVVIHPAEEGGFWAEVPALPGCHSEGETIEEVLANIRAAIEGCLSVDVKEVVLSSQDIVQEIEL
jgi:predicted RNase H-like HicB family nuclease